MSNRTIVECQPETALFIENKGVEKALELLDRFAIAKEDLKRHSDSKAMHRSKFNYEKMRKIIEEELPVFFPGDGIFMELIFQGNVNKPRFTRLIPARYYVRPFADDPEDRIVVWPGAGKYYKEHDVPVFDGLYIYINGRKIRVNNLIIE